MPRPQEIERPFRILITGVGGQGVLSATRALGEAARHAGVKVQLGQLHGMAQRGGSVEGSVVLGPAETAYVGKAAADVLLGFEPLEAHRARARLHTGSSAICNTHKLRVPLLANLGQEYPELESLVEALRQRTTHLQLVDASALAIETGEARALNVVMIGIAAGLGCLPLDKDAIRAGILAVSPEGLRASNERAFDRGLLHAESCPLP